MHSRMIDLLLCVLTYVSPATAESNPPGSWINRINPHWTRNGNAFWYVDRLADRGSVYWWVDAESGNRHQAFDADRVAAALAREMEQGIADPQTVAMLRNDLPVIDIQRIRNDQLLLVLPGAEATLDLVNYQIKLNTKSAVPPYPLLSLPLAETPEYEDWQQGCDLAAVRVVNHSGVPIDVIDVGHPDAPLDHVDVGSWGSSIMVVAGSILAVRDATGQSLGTYRVDGDGGQAVVNPPAPPSTGPAQSTQSGAHRDEWRTSPDGSWTASVRDGNVFLRSFRTDRATALTTDGHDGDAYSEGADRLVWAPDSRHLIAVRCRASDATPMQIVQSDPLDGGLPRLLTSPLTRAIDRRPELRAHLFDVAGGGHEVPIKADLFDGPGVRATPWWDASGRRFWFIYDGHGFQSTRVVGVDAESGRGTTVVDEHSNTFIDVSSEGKAICYPLARTHEVLWASERDGWNHLYLFDAISGRLETQLTRGSWVVRDLYSVDEEARRVLFWAGGLVSGQTPYYRHLCRVGLDGNGLVDLTPADGTHDVRFSPDGRFYLDRYSRVDLPPVTELRRTVNGSLVCEVERADCRALTADGMQLPERFVAKGRDGRTDIYGVIFRPPHFDPHRKYPVVEEVYADPGGTAVPTGFVSSTMAWTMASAGFIVVQADGMGTNYRSRAFHDTCYRNLSDAGFPDRIAWIKAAGGKYPQMDLSRVGIYGGSAGGDNAVRALLSHGDFYAAAVADCGVYDYRLSDTEFWMGWPIGPWYAQQSDVSDAAKLRGRLLLLGGEVDQTVDPANTGRMVDALISAGKHFDVLVVPNRGHCASTPYVDECRRQFLSCLKS